MIFIFQYHLHPEHMDFPKTRWCVIYFTLSLVLFFIVSVIDRWIKCGTHAFWVNLRDVLTHMLSASVLFFFLFLSVFSFLSAGHFYAFKIKNINMLQPAPRELYLYMNPQTHTFVIIEGRFIYNVQTTGYWYFAIFWLKLWWVSLHEILFVWIILSLGVILFIIGLTRKDYMLPV